MPRKTVELAYIVERGNYFLAHSEDEQREQRLGVASMVELALHKADAYGGYLHLESAEVRGEEYHRAWVDYREGKGDIPDWDDYCKDDSRRAYMIKGGTFPNTSHSKPFSRTRI